MNNAVVREVAKCPNDPAKCGFELERLENTVKDGGRTNLPTDTMEYINSRRTSQLNVEQDTSNVKSQIIQCQTEEDRNRLLQSIIKRQKIIREATENSCGPINYPTIYNKKCRCEKIPDDFQSISPDDIVMKDI